jgi:hypothetical protein
VKAGKEKSQRRGKRRKETRSQEMRKGKRG